MAFTSALPELRRLCDERNITLVTDDEKLINNFSSDRSFHTPRKPFAAALPNTVDDVAELVRQCSKLSVPMTPRGAGTGLEGACIPHYGGLVIDTSNLRRFELDAANQCCWVGAGVKKLEVVKRANAAGLHFGPDPASNPSVGGMCSTGGSGMSTLKYGTTRENVLALKVVTPDGSIVTTRQTVRKSSSGLDLTQLYCGSEGTLGIICEICFKLHPYLPHIAGGFAEFQTTESAVKSVVEIKRLGNLHALLRCELLNKEGVLAANKEYGTNLSPTPIILFEFSDIDSNLSYASHDFELMKAIFVRFGAVKVAFLPNGKELEDVWEARRGCLMAAGKFRGKRGEKLLNTDVCVPLSALASTVVATEADFAEAGVPCIICAHIADGNFHCLIPFQTEEEKQKVLELEFRMVRRAIAQGGTASGEHGVGIGKVKHLIAEHGQSHVDVQETIKHSLDPKNIMNPGIFYPSQLKAAASSSKM